MFLKMEMEKPFLSIPFLVKLKEQRLHSLQEVCFDSLTSLVFLHYFKTLCELDSNQVDYSSIPPLIEDLQQGVTRPKGPTPSPSGPPKEISSPRAPEDATKPKVVEYVLAHLIPSLPFQLVARVLILASPGKSPMPTNLSKN